MHVSYRCDACDDEEGETEERKYYNYSRRTPAAAEHRSRLLLVPLVLAVPARSPESTASCVLCRLYLQQYWLTACYASCLCPFVRVNSTEPPDGQYTSLVKLYLCGRCDRLIDRSIHPKYSALVPPSRQGEARQPLITISTARRLAGSDTGRPFGRPVLNSIDPPAPSAPTLDRPDAKFTLDTLPIDRPRAPLAVSKRPVLDGGRILHSDDDARSQSSARRMMQ